MQTMPGNPWIPVLTNLADATADLTRARYNVPSYDENEFNHGILGQIAGLLDTVDELRNTIEGF